MMSALTPLATTSAASRTSTARRREVAATSGPVARPRRANGRPLAISSEVFFRTVRRDGYSDGSGCHPRRGRRLGGDGRDRGRRQGRDDVAAAQVTRFAVRRRRPWSVNRSNRSAAARVASVADRRRPSSKLATRRPAGCPLWSHGTLGQLAIRQTGDRNVDARRVRGAVTRSVLSARQ
jgi:hypothetical protein